MDDIGLLDRGPEWGYCKVDGCDGEAFPLWLSGDYPDDPDLLLCPTHIGAHIAKAKTDLYRERDLNVRIRRWSRRFVLAVDRGNAGTIAVMRDCLVRRLDTDGQTTDDTHEEAALLAELDAADALATAVEQYHELSRACEVDRSYAADLGLAAYRLGAALASYHQARKG